MIFTSLTIRALKKHPGSGYYGREKGRISGSKITLSDTDGVPECDSIEVMAHVVLEELLNQETQVHKVG